MSGKKKDRGQRPPAAEGRVGTPVEPPNYDKETPKFCLHHVCQGFGVGDLNRDGQAAFAKTLQKLSSLTWIQIGLAGRHGSGFEYIGVAQIKASVPRLFQGEHRFMTFRYQSLLPMAGVRIRDVYHVLWIEPEFNRLYDHG